MAAVVALNTRLVSDSGLAKHRAQAVALAQDKLEELRTNLTANNFSLLTGGEDSCGSTTYPCGSAGFNRVWTITNNTGIPGEVSKNITVTVNWQDEKDDVQDVTLSSIVSWDDPVKQMLAVDDSDFEGLKSISPPTGGGKMNFSEFNPAGATSVKTPSGEKFGLAVVEYDNGVAVHDTTMDITEDQVWMTTDPGVIEITGTIKLSESDPPNNFSSDSSDTSRYFFDNNEYAKQSVLRSIAADAGICREKLHEEDGATYLDYLCYVGSKWYGRIGVMAVDGNRMLQNIEYYKSSPGSKPDRLCPHTYRYGSSCLLTGEFALEWDGETTVYCEGSPGKSYQFQVASVEGVHSETGEPMFYGTLFDQNFVVQHFDSECFDSVLIAGDITVTGDESAGIDKNEITVSASGDAFGCTFPSTAARNTDDDIKTGYYSCSIPKGWSGTINFSSARCTSITPASQSYANTEENQDLDMIAAGCIGNTYIVSGAVNDGILAFNPAIGFYIGDSLIDFVTCNLTDSASAYECRDVPGGTAGKVGFTAENCSADIDVYVDVTDTNVVNANATGWDISKCSKVTYTVTGFVNNSDGKWEVGSGKTKEDVTSIRVSQQIAGETSETICDTVSVGSKSSMSISYSCAFDAYPNREVSIRVRACPADGSPCMIESSPKILTLGNAKSFPLEHFTLKAP